MDILPVKVLCDEDNLIFGNLAVALGKLARSGLPVSPSIVLVAPNLKLKTVLEHYDFGSKEVFEQSLTLVKKEIFNTPIPEELIRETSKHKQFLVQGVLIKSTKHLWRYLLELWLGQIKNRLWKSGFYPGITEGLDPKIVSFVKKVESYGLAFFDSLSDEVIINSKHGKIHPADQKKLVELVFHSNKKLFIPHEYEWIIDRELNITRVLPFTPQIPNQLPGMSTYPIHGMYKYKEKTRSAVKVFFDLSKGFSIDEDIDGVYITSEKIFDLDEQGSFISKPRESFENLVFRLVESAITFPNCPVLFKLADKSEGMGKVRGTFRLLHQESLFNPLVEAVLFARNKKGLKNIHLVIPFVRTPSEFVQIKRELAVKKLIRKSFLQIWLEITTPENIINLEDYLLVGLDGVVLNLDELVSYLNGFDLNSEEVAFYKNEVSGLLKFLENALKLLHKLKIPFIVYGNLSLYPQVLEFLVEKGVYGVVIEKYEAHSIRDLLHQTEKKIILRKSA